MCNESPLKISHCKLCNKQIVNEKYGRKKTLCSPECRKIYSRISTAASFALKSPEERKAIIRAKNVVQAMRKRGEARQAQAAHG